MVRSSPGRCPVGWPRTQYIVDNGKPDVVGKALDRKDMPVVDWVECAAYDSNQSAVSTIGLVVSWKACGRVIS